MADKNSSTAPALHEVPFIGASQDNAEAKPKRRRAAKIKTVPPAPALAMTADEMRIITGYRAMRNQAQVTLLGIVDSLANAFPDRPAPFLRLV